MRLATVVLFVLLLALSALAFADFTYVGKLPAPRPFPGCPVLGMTSNEYHIFVTVATDTSQWFYFIDPDDGYVMDSHEWDLHAYGWPRFEGASHEGGDIYWVAEEGGELVRFEWSDGVVSPVDTVLEACIVAPKGMAYRDMGESFGENMVADAEWDSIFAVGIFGGIAGAADLSGIPFIPPLNPTSVSMLGGNYYFTSEDSPDTVFEANGAMERVDAHYLPMPSWVTPRAATFYNGLYYVGSASDSIYIFSTGSYADSVPGGPDVVVEIVPEGLTVSFDSVATAGSLYVEVTAVDSCPAPGGVVFFGDYYDVSTSAEFDYITTVEMMTDEPLPSWVMMRRVRVFKRPSDVCSYWRDITVQGLEVEEPPREPSPFRVNTRTLSEDDEFSIFTLGEDSRSPGFVIGLKYDYLESAIVDNEDSIPNDTYNTLRSVLTNSETAYDAHRHAQAARLANRVADITRDTPAIPHRYEPGTDRINVAGRIIARAHTLAFSLDLLIEEEAFGPGGAKSKEPPSTVLEPSPMNTLISGPNPSASGFKISLSGNSRHPVSVRVYSVKGELVSSLLESELIMGERSLTWDGRNHGGEAVSAGTYFIVVSEGENTVTRKVILRK